MESNDQYLPNEVLSIIFGNLNPKDKSSASLVSRSCRLLVGLTYNFKRINVIVKGLKYTEISDHNRKCLLPYNRFMRIIHSYSKRVRAINSIICRRDRIYVDIGNHIIAIKDNGITQSNTDFEIVKKIQLEPNDQAYLECDDKDVEYYVKEKRSEAWFGPNYITVSRLHIIQIYLGDDEYNCARRYKSKESFEDLTGKSISDDSYESVFIGTYFATGVIYPMMAACDSKENIYILNYMSIKKYDLYWNFVEVLKFDYSWSILDSLIWLSIHKDRLYICTCHTIFICDLNGSLIFKIDKIFNNLKCLAFSDDDIVVADGFDILKISL